MLVLAGLSCLLESGGQQQQQPPCYGHYTGQPALAGTSSLELRILLVQSFTGHKPLLTATSDRRQQGYVGSCLQCADVL